MPVILPVELNVTVPVPQANVPELVQVPATFMLALGAVNAPEIVTLLNVFVLEPETVVVPLNVKVPVPQLNMPEFAQLPATFILAFGAVRVPVMVRLLNVFVLELETVVKPLNVTVPPLALNVPEFAQLPDTFMLIRWPVKLPVILTL